MGAGLLLVLAWLELWFFVGAGIEGLAAFEKRWIENEPSLSALMGRSIPWFWIRSCATGGFLCSRPAGRLWLNFLRRTHPALFYLFACPSCWSGPWICWRYCAAESGFAAACGTATLPSGPMSSLWASLGFAIRFGRWQLSLGNRFARLHNPSGVVRMPVSIWSGL